MGGEGDDNTWKFTFGDESLLSVALGSVQILALLGSPRVNVTAEGSNYFM